MADWRNPFVTELQTILRMSAHELYRLTLKQDAMFGPSPQTVATDRDMQGRWFHGIVEST
jgi:hypothetical protein